MAAGKPRTGDGPLQAELEPRGQIVVKIPAEGGGRIQIGFNEAEIEELIKELKRVLAESKKR